MSNLVFSVKELLLGQVLRIAQTLASGDDGDLKTGKGGKNAMNKSTICSSCQSQTVYIEKLVLLKMCHGSEGCIGKVKGQHP